MSNLLIFEVSADFKIQDSLKKDYAFRGGLLSIRASFSATAS